jgi:hypothetical protein
MRARKILARIDGEIALTREAVERSREAIEWSSSRYIELAERGERDHRELMEQSERRYQEQLQVTREVIRRNELAFNEFVGVLGRLVERVDEWAEETRAQSRAIFALIDRLEGGGTAAAG